jgi:battenin
MMAATTAASSAPRTALAGFWLLGCLNNSSYVIMIAGANDISPSAVGIVYLAAIFPALAVKTAAPYFFDRVSYRSRVLAAALLMALSFCLVGLGRGEVAQLAGVALASLQGGLGEATALALCGARLGAEEDNGNGLDRRRAAADETATLAPSSTESGSSARRALAMWSSGSGAAGLFGYLWVSLLHKALGLPFSATVLLANTLAVAWVLSYARLVEGGGWGGDGDHEGRRRAGMGGGAAATAGGRKYRRVGSGAGDDEDEDEHAGGGETRQQHHQVQLEMVSSRTPTPTHAHPGGGFLRPPAPPPPPDPSSSGGGGGGDWRARALAVLSLYPYTLPLFAVYFAEYLMQSGVWPSIGLPSPEDADHRRAFYLAAGTAYQAGVFLSRSSGLLPASVPRPGRRGLATMAAAQVGLLAFFAAEALFGGGGGKESSNNSFVADLFYGWAPLMTGCFGAGLLGGGVYVGAFSLIAVETPSDGRAFALGSASVADAAGIALADATGILVQGCLFRAHHIAGAAFSCGAEGG